MKKFSPNTNNVFNNDQSKIKQKGKISHGDIDYLPIGEILPGKYQVRKDFSLESLQELQLSIAQQGLLQPVTVRKLENSKYELISGERRWRASKMAGLTHIPAIISYFTDESALALGIIENIQRENLNVIEEANGYQKLINEFEYTHNQISESVGKSRAHITNLLRILTLSEQVQHAVTTGTISLGHAKVILSVSENKRDVFLRDIIDKNLSVRSAEAHRSKIPIKDYSLDTKLTNHRYLNNLQTDALNKLRSVIAGRVILKQINHGRYKLECDFDSYEDFELFVSRHIEELAD